MPRRQPSAVRGINQPETALRGQHHRLGDPGRPTGEPAADDFLRHPAAIHIGRIDQRAARLGETVELLMRTLLIRLRPEGHGPQAETRYRAAATPQSAIVHILNLRRRRHQTPPDCAPSRPAPCSGPPPRARPPVVTRSGARPTGEIHLDIVSAFATCREDDSDPVRGARSNAVHAQSRASARFSTWKTRPTRSRVVYAQTVTRELEASFPCWPESYQQSGQRYWPAGCWLFCRSATDSLAYQCRPAPAIAAARRSPAR